MRKTTTKFGQWSDPFWVRKSLVGREHDIVGGGHLGRGGRRETTDMMYLDARIHGFFQCYGVQDLEEKEEGDPPWSEPCSAEDVLYQKIRTLLVEGVVDRFTEHGGAFKSRYSYGEEITLKIVAFGSGGMSFSSPSGP
jgi:hypothetical protein